MDLQQPFYTNYDFVTRMIKSVIINIVYKIFSQI